MNILTIDASTDFEITGLKTSSGIFDGTQRVDRSHSVTLFDNLRSLLDRASVSPDEIGLIAAGLGPGSFTGIRIAVSTARALAQALSVPVVGLKSHHIFAASFYYGDGGYILPAFDAKKNRVFAALYRETADPLFPEEIIPPGDYYIDFALSALETGAPVRFFGSGAEKYIEDLKKIAPAGELLAERMPSGAVAVSIAEKMFAGDSGIFRFDSVVPFYSRVSDAEMMLEKRLIDQR